MLAFFPSRRQDTLEKETTYRETPFRSASPPALHIAERKPARSPTSTILTGASEDSSHQRCTAGYTFSLPLRCDARALPTEKQIFGQLSFLRCSPGTLLLQCHAFDIARRCRPHLGCQTPVLRP
ncbi:hypothetical protein HBI09_108810 [Parastagonospora nodorum]|nr:hypothetical protein HBI09_108810 [Parastagonospora nodorum]KAH5012786.1 hypothetical protein HBI77_076140 [Parastagonospora nodorum]